MIDDIAALIKIKNIKSKKLTLSSAPALIAFTKYNEEKPSETACKNKSQYIAIEENIVNPAMNISTRVFMSEYDVTNSDVQFCAISLSKSNE